MNLETHNDVKSIYEMESSIQAVECLVNQGGFETEVQSLLGVLAKDLRATFDTLSTNLIKRIPHDNNS